MFNVYNRNDRFVDDNKTRIQLSIKLLVDQFCATYLCNINITKLQMSMPCIGFIFRIAIQRYKSIAARGLYNNARKLIQVCMGTKMIKIYKTHLFFHKKQRSCQLRKLLYKMHLGVQGRGMWKVRTWNFLDSR